jgi:hypothetical protein
VQGSSLELCNSIQLQKLSFSWLPGIVVNWLS